MSIIPTTVLTVLYSLLVSLICSVFPTTIYASETLAFRSGNEDYKIQWDSPMQLQIIRLQDSKILAKCQKIQTVSDLQQIQPQIDLECHSAVIPAFKTLATYTPASLDQPSPEIRFGNWLGGYHGFGLTPVTTALR